MKEHFFENEYAAYWGENGVIVESYKETVRYIDINIAKVTTESLQSILQLYDERMPLLVETNKVFYMDRTASKMYSEHNNMTQLKAIGVLVNNPAAILGGKLFIALNKPKVKFDFFKDRNKAIEWLGRFKSL